MTVRAASNTDNRVRKQKKAGILNENPGYITSSQIADIITAAEKQAAELCSSCFSAVVFYSAIVI